MVCELGDDTAWPSLLEARALLARGDADLVFARRQGAWQCRPAGAEPLHDADQVFAFSPPDSLPDAPLSVYAPADLGTPGFVHPTGRPVDAGFLSMARVYLPVLLGAAAARRRGRSFVAGHVTQTLDGRIACANGQSQWIGNTADLRHSHRMRALLDGVLIGAGTLCTDDPRLDVRHVDGPNPRRIVLSGSGRALREPPDRNVFRPPGCDVVVGHATAATPDGARVAVVAPSGDDELDPAAVLTALRDRGVQSIYLEGGAVTLSSFLRAGCIDLLQVHVAAMVLGSGVPSFTLPPVDHVDRGLRFDMDHAMLDGHVLLSCWPRPEHGAA